VKFKELNAINSNKIKCSPILVLNLRLNTYQEKYLDDVVSSAVVVVVGVTCLFR
jgi:hypothetical protein